MKKKTLYILAGITLAILCAAALVQYTTAIGCSPIPPVTPMMGSQGFRAWSGPTLISFEHGGKKICIDEGWTALGEKDSGTGWATFEKEKTGVAVQKSAFSEKTLTFVYSAYEVRLIYPKNIPPAELELYEATVRNAFERVGKLFNDSKDNPKRTHTVLLTPGVERTDGLQTPVYPDARENLSIYVQPPQSARGEELILHAIAHLYNRERPDLLAYQKHQSPLPPGDFQELEASWSESAYRTSNAGLRSRAAYLYNVHTAVQMKNFSLITAAPFNADKKEFEDIRPSVVVPSDASFLTAQYGHYILGPLTMLATEGMLRENKAGITIEKILSRVHAEKTNYFETLSEYLSSEEMAALKSWMFEKVTVPYALVEAGMKTYTGE